MFIVSLFPPLSHTLFFPILFVLELQSETRRQSYTPSTLLGFLICVKSPHSRDYFLSLTSYCRMYSCRALHLHPNPTYSAKDLGTTNYGTQESPCPNPIQKKSEDSTEGLLLERGASSCASEEEELLELELLESESRVYWKKNTMTLHSLKNDHGNGNTLDAILAFWQNCLQGEMSKGHIRSQWNCRDYCDSVCIAHHHTHTKRGKKHWAKCDLGWLTAISNSEKVTG